MYNQKIEEDIFEFFGEGHDRFGFPEGMWRITSMRGGESYFINGSEKCAIYDCGMAYCGPLTVENIKESLEMSGHDTLDFILLSHSHYDHMGALPYIKAAFPDAIVVGSEKCAKILERPNAKLLIKDLGTVARDLYTPDSDLEIRTDHLEVEMIVHDGDVISLGDETITVLETKGHTDCSLTYAVEPMNLLICCESTGLIESLTYVNTPILKSFDDAMASFAKVRGYGAKYVCLPHFGLLPTDFNDTYWDMFKAGCDEVVDFARQMRNDGLAIEEMVEQYYNRYWNPLFIKEQPKKAYFINAEATIKAALKATYR